MNPDSQWLRSELNNPRKEMLQRNCPGCRARIGKENASAEGSHA